MCYLCQSEDQEDKLPRKRKRRVVYIQPFYPPILSGHETITLEQALDIAVSYQQHPGKDGWLAGVLTQKLNVDDVRLVYFSFIQEFHEEGEVPGWDQASADYFYRDWLAYGEPSAPITGPLPAAA